MQQDFDTDLLLEEGSKREQAHAAHDPRAVGNVHCVHSLGQEVLRAFHLLVASQPLGGTTFARIGNSARASFSDSRERFSRGMGSSVRPGRSRTSTATRARCGSASGQPL